MFNRFKLWISKLFKLEHCSYTERSKYARVDEEEEAEMCNLYDHGYEIGDIEYITHRSRSTVKKYLKKNGRIV